MERCEGNRRNGQWAIEAVEAKKGKSKENADCCLLPAAWVRLLIFSAPAKQRIMMMMMLLLMMTMLRWRFFFRYEEGVEGRERTLGGWQQICVKNSLVGQNCVGQHEKRIKSLKQAIKAAAQVAAMLPESERERKRGVATATER